MGVGTLEGSGPDRPHHMPIRSSASVRHPSDIKRDLAEEAGTKARATARIEELVEELSVSLKVYP